MRDGFKRLAVLQAVPSATSAGSTAMRRFTAVLTPQRPNWFPTEEFSAQRRRRSSQSSAHKRDSLNPHVSVGVREVSFSQSVVGLVSRAIDPGTSILLGGGRCVIGIESVKTNLQPSTSE